MKTPIPLLVLAAWGGVRALMGSHECAARVPLASAALILLVASLSNIDGGLRYILPIYPMMALLAGVAAAGIVSRRSTLLRAVLGATLAAQIAVCAAAWPDYLAFFNPLAGPAPERVLADSDIDWGQDIDRVAQVLRDRGVHQVWVALHTNARLEHHGFPPFRDLPAHRIVRGWVAISATQYDWATGPAPFDYFAWLKLYKPVAIIGKSRTRLYHIGPQTGTGSIVLGSRPRLPGR